MYGKIIEENFDEYIYILKYFLKVSTPKESDNKNIRNKKRMSGASIEKVSTDCFGKRAQRVYEKLKKRLTFKQKLKRIFFRK